MAKFVGGNAALVKAQMSLIALVNCLPISVIIPCFRCTGTIQRALDSVLQQTQQPTEIILIDDASGDETSDLLHALKRQYAGQVKLVTLEHNVGAASARNMGWATATQPYLAFLDADDAWHPQKLDIQFTYMKKNPDVALCGHNHRVIKATNALPEWTITENIEATSINKWSLLLSNKFITPSVMLRRNIKFRFNETQRHMEDHLLWLEILCSGERITKLSADLAAIYKQPFGESGLSAQIWLMEKSDLNNYKQLRNKNYINSLQWIFLNLYSLVKFIRRLVIYWGHIKWIKQP
jgi:glycosyltransferase involved in cell wall biosynthesis